MRTHPYTLQEVTALQTEALSRQSPEALAAAGADLGALAAAAALSNEQAGRIVTAAGIEAIADPDARASLETAFDRTEQLFGRVRLTPPTAEQLTQNGVDLAALGVQHERMTREGLEPAWVLAPILETGHWKQLYGNLEQDSTLNHNGRIKAGGLYIDDDLSAAWSSLCDLPPTLPVTPLEVPGQATSSWTLRLIPATNGPTETNITHNDPSYPDKPTVHEYLTLQATRLQANEDPLDNSTWTWLSGTVPDGSRAPVGDWGPDGGQVKLGRIDVDYRLGNLGVRLPVWG